MRILIAGGRDFSDKDFLYKYMDKFKEDCICVISGCASGADKMGEKWAKDMGIPIERFPAQWARYGRKAGPLRNIEMLEKGKPDLVVVFKGGTGSAHMASISKKAGVKTLRPRRGLNGN